MAIKIKVNQVVEATKIVQQIEDELITWSEAVIKLMDLGLKTKRVAQVLGKTRATLILKLAIESVKPVNQ